MPISPFDIAIILISSVACIYCIVLSRRLRALQNTRNGLGATIKALSDSISAVSATTDETRFHAGELAARLARLIEEAFLNDNPELSPDQITITCKQGYIQEARICLTRELEFRECGADVVRDCGMSNAQFDPMR